MKKIFVINGSGGVGKDTFIEVLSSFHPSVFQTSSVDPTKTLATQVGWQGGKTDKDRKFLSDFKDLLTEYNDYPMQFLTERVKDIMFIHIREPREIEKAVKAFGAQTILITAEGRVAPHLPTPPRPRIAAMPPILTSLVKRAGSLTLLNRRLFTSLSPLRSISMPTLTKSGV